MHSCKGALSDPASVAHRRSPAGRRGVSRLLVALALLLAACSGSPEQDGRRGPTALFGEYYPTGGSSIGLSVESCGGDPEVRTLEETRNAVRVEVVATTYVPGDGCADGITVDLDAPVGRRTVIDLTSGRELARYTP